MYDFDLFVIGAGSGGVRAARMAGQTGAKVAVAEYAPLGGTCVNLGCIPKKLYSYAAHYAESFEESHGFGWEGQAPSLNWETLKTNRAKEINRLNGIYGNLLKNSGVTLIEGKGSLIDAHTVAVNGKHYSAKNILIATGGWPTVPNIPGKELAITSNEIFDLAHFPQRLLVVGGGYIASEFASIFNGLGSQVTQLYRGQAILRGFDKEVSEFTATEMQKSGVSILFNTNVNSIEQQADGLHIVLTNGQTVVADQILYATGRHPNTAGLNLDSIGVKTHENGSIVVNNTYETSVDSIYAVGDVCSKIQLTPVALAEAMVVVDQLFGDGKKPSLNYDLIPTAVFTHPNIGTVGLSEEQAREQYKDIKVYKSDFRALKHTLSGSQARTFMKLIVDSATDKVVGLHMVGEEAGEIIQGFAVALKAGATKAVFDSTIGIHPTAAEEFVTMRTPSA